MNRETAKRGEGGGKFARNHQAKRQETGKGIEKRDRRDGPLSGCCRRCSPAATHGRKEEAAIDDEERGRVEELLLSLMTCGRRGSEEEKEERRSDEGNRESVWRKPDNSDGISTSILRQSDGGRAKQQQE